MLFNSYIFIFVFLPITLLGYFFLNHIQQYKTGKLFLVGMSLWFYAYFHLSYLWILLCSISLNYICHRLILRGKHRRIITFGGILINVGILYYFKYLDFMLENINYFFHAHIPLTGILLPLGISFFTFQQIAFLADTAKGTVEKQTFLDYALFVSFFPQLVAGPIVSHEEMLPQFNDLSKKRFSYENFYYGLRLFILGLSKKILLADTFGRAVSWGFENYTVLDGFNTFIVGLFYTLQLYLDFSGYCDMARGIGKFFNIELPVNFLSPYKAANISEFWDRWHITLTRFFTRYVYIPLGGNRKGIPRTCINIFLVFCISGIWHGAGWTFLLWGVLHGTLSVLTRLWHICKPRIFPSLHEKRQGKVLPFLLHTVSVLLTFFFVTCCWIIFRADTISQAGYMLSAMLTPQPTHLYLEWTSFFSIPDIIEYAFKVLHFNISPYCCLGGFMIFTFIMIFCSRNLYESESTHTPSIFSILCMVCLLVWCIISLSGVNTFLYFNF